LQAALAFLTPIKIQLTGCDAHCPHKIASSVSHPRSSIKVYVAAFYQRIGSEPLIILRIRDEKRVDIVLDHMAYKRCGSVQNAVARTILRNRKNVIVVPRERQTGPVLLVREVPHEASLHPHVVLQ
jgi:hypothetical protein